MVFSGDTKPTRTLVEAAAGCDLLIHETFLPPQTFSELMGLPLAQAELVVEGAHTSARAAGVVFEMVRPRMAAMWQCMVVDGYVEPIFADVALSHDGPTTLCQDLTVFDVTEAAVSARQARVDPVAPTVIGTSHTERELGAPRPTPAWWQNAAIDWRAHVD